MEELGLVGVWRGQGEEEVWEKKKERKLPEVEGRNKR